MKQERLRACCVNFRTVRQGGKVSIFKRIKYAFNPLPMNWRTTYVRLVHENKAYEPILLFGGVMIGFTLMLIMGF